MSERAPQRPWEKAVEILEVSALAIVAIATAFSGYQGTQWGGEQARLYGLASSTRFEAEAASTFGGQELVADSSFLTAWLQARQAGDRQLQEILERRFTPEYADAFRDWLATDPFKDPDAPPGPAAMPGYANPSMTKAARLNARASAYFVAGTDARETANKYVRQTVLFASVLFIVAVAQRFRLRGVRIGANALALALLAFTVYGVGSLPRI
ncbi:MAG: hypothetical protein WB297_08610 [Actinomycetota bacterium]